MRLPRPTDLSLLWADVTRRWQGAALTGLGFGPDEAPWRTVLSRPGMRLRAYGGGGPVLTIVPAPIKRPYIWDLSPGRSVVRQALGRGFAVFLIEWLDVAGSPRPRGLDDYAYRLILEALDAVAAETGRRQALLAGHSLGGTLAAVFATLEPERVAGLLLIETPLHFGDAAGGFAPMLKAAPGSPDAVAGSFETVPGSLLDLASAAAIPRLFVLEPLLDAARSAVDPEALAIHLSVRRWTLDEFALPAELFRDVVGGLYRDDLFHAGRLVIAGRPARPEALRMPVASVIDRASPLVPPDSALAPLRVAEAAPRLVLDHPAEGGVMLRHVGALAGREAHRSLWPQLLAWLARTWDDAAGAAQ